MSRTHVEPTTIRKVAKRFGVDPDVFDAMINQESGRRRGSTGVQSSAGARGVAQFMGPTADAYGVNLNDGKDMDDLEGAARYLKDNLERTGGDYKGALSIYNSGRPDAYKDPGFADGQTYNYVRSIMGASGGAPKRGKSSGSPTRRLAEQTTERTDFDEKGFEAASRKAATGRFLAGRNPNSLLVKLGVTPTEGPNPQDFTTTSQETVRYPAPEPKRGRSGSGGKQGGMSPLLELFWRGQGAVNVKDGKLVGNDFVTGHEDHVHAAAGPKTVRKLAELAEEYGLDVRELPGYDRVDPVHTEGSYHYRNGGQALDASGDPEDMAAYAAAVARKFGIKRR